MKERKELRRSRQAEMAAGERYQRYMASGFINMKCLGRVPIKQAKEKQEYIELYELPTPDNIYCVGAWYTGGRHDVQIWPRIWFIRNLKKLLDPPIITREEFYSGKKVYRKILKVPKKVSGIKRKTLK